MSTLKLYTEQTEIINYSTYIGAEGTDDFNMYIFIMAQCCVTTVLDLPEAT